jgi:hypothetical protein
MKSLKTIILFLFAAIWITTSCKKDDDNNQDSSNYLEYKGSKYALSKGFVEDYGRLNEGVYDVDITLVSSGINIIVENGEVEDLTGTGNLIYIDFRSAVPKAVGSGTYTFDLTDEAGTMIFGIIALDYNVVTEVGIELLVTGGQVTVVRSGNNYELDFNLIVNGSETVKGKFKGSLPYYDYSSGFRGKSDFITAEVK